VGKGESPTEEIFKRQAERDAQVVRAESALAELADLTKRAKLAKRDDLAALTERARRIWRRAERDAPDMVVDLARIEQLAGRLAGRAALAKGAESPDQDEDPGLRAAQVASRLSEIWTRFGSFLPPRSKKLLEYDLAEHRSDFFAALVEAKTRRELDRLIVRFTIAALGKVLDRTRVAIQNRLQDEFNWVARRLPRK
jgi:hypothetical protein